MEICSKWSSHQKDSWITKGQKAFLLCTLLLWENVSLVGGMEYIKMEHEIFFSASCFSPNYLYSTVHLIVSAHCVCSFHSSCFPILPLPFISMCHSSGALLIFLLPPYFPIFLNHHNSLLCLEQIIPTTITEFFLPLSEHNTYTERPILLMQLARSSYDFNIF